MLYAIAFALLVNMLSLGLIVWAHRKGARHILACGLFFLVLALSIFASFYGYLPDAVKASALYSKEESEFFIALITFVPLLFAANLISKGLDRLYPKP